MNMLTQSRGHPPRGIPVAAAAPSTVPPAVLGAGLGHCTECDSMSEDNAATGETRCLLSGGIAAVAFQDRSALIEFTGPSGSARDAACIPAYGQLQETEGVPLQLTFEPDPIFMLLSGAGAQSAVPAECAPREPS